MQLDKRLHERILKDCKAATKSLDKGRYEAAIALFQSSIDLLPEPKTQWEAAEWIYAHQGDAYYESEKFDEARACFQMAYNAQEAEPNPFVLLRLGECEFRLGNESIAAQHLVGAYMLEGDELFSEEPRDIVEFVNRLTS